jgi:hypothetical protein
LWFQSSQSFKSRWHLVKESHFLLFLISWVTCGEHSTGSPNLFYPGIFDDYFQFSKK